VPRHHATATARNNAHHHPAQHPTVAPHTARNPLFPGHQAARSGPVPPIRRPPPALTSAPVDWRHRCRSRPLKKVKAVQTGKPWSGSPPTSAHALRQDSPPPGHWAGLDQRRRRRQRQSRLEVAAPASVLGSFTPTPAGVSFVGDMAATSTPGFLITRAAGSWDRFPLRGCWSGARHYATAVRLSY